MKLIISTEQNSHFSVAVAQNKIIASQTVRRPFKQTELLLKTIIKLSPVNKIKAIIVVQGPGEFSALRIGIATANALGFALNVPVVGVRMPANKNFKDELEKLNYLWLRGSALLKKTKQRKIILPYYDKEPNINIKK